MVDGSFLAFLQNNPIKVPGLSDAEGSELLGARLVGRWKSSSMPSSVNLPPDRPDHCLALTPIIQRDHLRYLSCG
ncbi:hypothetical protein JOM56_013226 [Amanita muscaria]